jgi:hypothetical protein
LGYKMRGSAIEGQRQDRDQRRHSHRRTKFTGYAAAGVR